MKIEIDTGGRALTDEHVFELVRLKQGATDPVYFILAKLVDAVEQAVADEKAAAAKAKLAAPALSLLEECDRVDKIADPYGKGYGGFVETTKIRRLLLRGES